MKFVEFTLESTENVRRILQAECDEANFVLRPWVVESLVTRQVDGDSCTCIPSIDAEVQAQEIATGIEKALAQAQKFRQAISLKIIEDKRKQSKPTLQGIYGLSTYRSGAKPIVTEKEIKNGKKTKVTDQSVRSKPKNFIAANKMSVRTISQRNSKSSNDLRTAGNNKTSLRTFSRYPSVTELDNLIKKFSLESPNSASSPSLETANENCPVHCDNQRGIITERKQITMDLVEALNQFGVPEDLLKPLKIYHSYVSKSNDERRKGRVHEFFHELDSFNEKQCQTFPPTKYVKLIRGFGELHRDLHEMPETPTSLKKKYFELDNLSKVSNIKRYDTLKTRRSDANVSRGYRITHGWLHNGIWNPTSYQIFSMFTKPLTIQYSSKNELLSLFLMTQRLQLTRYQKDLNDLIVDIVIPLMERINPSSEEYLCLYKMIFTIAQVVNPKPPVLVNIEDD